jgi:deoxyribodipyrimidine photo-lyase
VVPPFAMDARLMSTPNRARFVLECLADLRAGLHGRAVTWWSGPAGRRLRPSGSPRKPARRRYSSPAMPPATPRAARRRWHASAHATGSNCGLPRASRWCRPGSCGPPAGSTTRCSRRTGTRGAKHGGGRHCPRPTRYGCRPGCGPELCHAAAAPHPASYPGARPPADSGRGPGWTARSGYAAGHDDLAGDRTSRLSAYLRFGCLSPLELARLARRCPGGGSSPGSSPGVTSSTRSRPRFRTRPGRPTGPGSGGGGGAGAHDEWDDKLPEARARD